MLHLKVPGMAAVPYGSTSVDDTVKYQPVRPRPLFLSGKTNNEDQYLCGLRYQGTKIPGFQLKALKNLR